jgi:outer membrane protein insertion porin family
MNKIKKILIGFGALNIFLNAYAFNQFKIKNIRINGLQRIELGTVYSYIGIKSGDMLTDNVADNVLKNLYQTGFFQDIKLDIVDEDLIINVIERPVIAELSISGDNSFDHDKLIKAINDNGLITGKIFDKAILEQAILSLKSEYYNRGLYSVKIDYQVLSVSRNRVVVNIAINEGSVAKISQINLIGNNQVKTKTLRDLMFLNNGSLFSFWYKNNQYSNDKLSGDLENIRAYYLNHGYINFKINSIQVQLSEDKKQVYITINLDEGDKYSLSDIKVSGNTKSVKIDDLQKLITLSVGKTLNQQLLNKNIEAIKEKLGEYGYAYTNITPIPTLNKENKTVSYVLFIDTGDKVYVRNINVVGNDKTRDVVIRREFRQIENSLYDIRKIKRSKERLNLLGFFKPNTINITPEPVLGTNNQMDLKVKVEENNTGAMNFNIGFAQGQGLILGVGVNQTNIFGSGKAASLNASTSLLSKSVTLMFTDPYYLINGSSLGYDAYYTEFTPNVVNISPYSTQTLGTKVRLSVPVSEYDKINFGLGFEHVAINLTGNFVPLRFAQFTNNYGSFVDDIPFSISWLRNTTDSMAWPTTGGLYSEMFDMTLPVIGPRYYRFTSQNSWFLPISDNFTWKTNFQLGFIDSYGSSGLVPFYSYYYMGGVNTIRGFYLNTLGPRDTDSASLGGTKEILLSNELLFPMPFIKDDHTVRMSLFLDSGTLWGGNNFNLTPSQEFRASYGLGMVWNSPLGPIKLSYAKPLITAPNDIIEPFQFVLGASF